MARSIHESFSSIQCGIWHRPNKRPWLRILQTVKFKMSNYCVLPGRRYVDLAAQGTKRDSEMLTVAEVLLVADVPVGGDKDIKQTFGKAEKFAILNASPSARTRGAALVAYKDFVHRPGCTLIK